VAEECLVAGRTVGAGVTDDVATADQRRVAEETREVTVVPVAVHRFRRLARKYQLHTTRLHVHGSNSGTGRVATFAAEDSSAGCTSCADESNHAPPVPQ